MEKLIEFKNAANLSKYASIHSQIDDNVFFCHILPGADALSQIIEKDPMKISGSMLLLICSGSEFDVEINLEKYRVSQNSLLLLLPGHLIQAKGHVPTDLEVYALYFDTKFSRNININLNTAIVPSAALGKPRSIVNLTDEEVELLLRYFLLIHSSTIDNINSQMSISIASSLTAALCYQLVSFHYNRLPNEIAGEINIHTGSRRNDYVREFIRLVHLHYVRERSVAFYADKLFISPKYLSLLVKETTGRSAAAWIDEFVLMEAKNMLRFSGKNIQQIAYTLNFPTQSSFGKYFKHLTGLSPSEYQKS